jgi:site-specific DNA recombinase
MKAIGYVRISAKDQSVYSLDAQEASIREYCIKNELHLVAVYRDDGECSESFDRPDYLALENFVRDHKGAVQYLLILDHDRFSRNLSEALAKITELEKKFSVKVLAVDEPITLDTSDPEVFLGRALKYMLANHELLKIRKRTAKGLRNAMEAGRIVNNAPFGYINARDVNDKPIVVIDSHKAEIVRGIFDEYISGVSKQLILKNAYQKGFKRTGHSAIERILSNCVYAGLIKVPANGDKPEKIVKGLHEPIIPESVYWVAQQLLKGSKGRKSQPKGDFPLRGIIKCNCGSHMTAAYSKGKKKYYMYYQCVKERGRNYRGEKLHELVESMLTDLSFNADQVEQIRTYGREELTKVLAHRQIMINAKEQSLNDVKGKIEKLEEKMINDEVEPITYKKWFAKLNGEKGSLEREVTELKQKKKNIFDRFDEVIPDMCNLGRLYAALPLEGKQMLLNKVFEVGIIYDGERLRTPMINPALISNYLRIKENGLIKVDQPDDVLLNLEGCTAYGIRTRITTVKGWCPNP